MQIGHNGVWVVAAGRLEGGKLKKGKHKLTVLEKVENYF